MKIKRRLRLFLLVAVCGSLTGCALVNLPLQLASGIMDLASRLPMPPPGVFF